MKIQTVKISGQGYAVDYGDGVIWSVSVDGCGYDKVLAWLSEGNIPEPEFTYEELVAIEVANKKQEALKYLVNTAWYIERLNDPSSGKAIPEEVLAKRAEARLILDEGAK